MIRKTIFIFAIIIIFSCNKKTKKSSDAETNNPIKVEHEIKASSFEDKLLDIRDLKDSFNSELKIEKFGMQKFNDSLFAFVFKLENSVTNEIIKKYSFGMRGYSSDLDKPFLSNFTPELSIIENNEYLILKRQIKNTKYFDSLDVYIYERKNWKKSGRLGGIMIRDILFE